MYIRRPPSVESNTFLVLPFGRITNRMEEVWLRLLPIVAERSSGVPLGDPVRTSLSLLGGW